MFELIFGIIWLTITSMVAIPFLLIGISDTGMPILFFIVFFGIFYAIGITMLRKGLKNVARNKATDKNGFKTYGLITNIYGTNQYVNDCEQLKADVIFVTDDNDKINKCSEVIGFDWDKYGIGDYVHIKYFQNDINILGKAYMQSVPEGIRQQLEQVALNKYQRQKEEKQEKDNQQEPPRVNYTRTQQQEKIVLPDEDDWNFSGTQNN